MLGLSEVLAGCSRGSVRSNASPFFMTSTIVLQFSAHNSCSLLESVESCFAHAGEPPSPPHTTCHDSLAAPTSLLGSTNKQRAMSNMSFILCESLFLRITPMQLGDQCPKTVASYTLHSFIVILGRKVSLYLLLCCGRARVTFDLLT